MSARHGLTVLAILLLSGPARAVVEVGFLDLGYELGEMVVTGDRAFLANGRDGLAILDLSDPRQPALLGREPARGAIGVDLVGPHLYLAANERLMVFDVSDPNAPVRVSALNSGTTSSRVRVADGIAYVASAEGLWTADVSDPSRPRFLGRLEVGSYAEPRGLELNGSILYLADARAGLRVIDVSNPAAPRVVSTVGGVARGLLLEGDLIYFAGTPFPDAGGVYLLIADISVPDQPRLLLPRLRLESFSRELGEVAPRRTGEVAVRNGVAFVSTGRWLHAIDVSDPRAPRLLGRTPMGAGPSTLDLVGGLLYQSHPERGWIQVLEVTNPSFPIQLSRIQTGSQLRPYDLEIDGGVASVLGGLALKLYDVSRSSEPAYLGGFGRYWNSAQDAVVSKGHAFVAGLWGTGPEARRWVGLVAFDVSDPGRPARVGSLKTSAWDQGGPLSDIELEGDLLYGAHGETGLRILDLSNPEDPVELGDRDVLGDPSQRVARDAQRLVLANRFAFVSLKERGLEVVDVSDPAHPRAVGRLDGQWSSRDIEVREGVAYVAGDRGVIVIGVWNPTQPVELGRIRSSPNWYNDVELEGVRLYVSADEGQSIHDVSDPEAPRLLGFVERNGGSEGIAVHDGLVYASYPHYNWISELRVFDYGPEYEVDPEAHPSGCRAAPRSECWSGLESGGAKLKLRRRDGKLRFRWGRDVETPLEDLGEPDLDTGYGLCLYDFEAGEPVLRLRAALPAGKRWRRTESGYRYTSSTGGPHGIAGARLSTDPQARQVIQVRGRAQLPLPLSQAGEVRAQLVNDAGGCWEARFAGSALRNDGERFLDKTRGP